MNANPTKEDELAVLDRAIAELPEGSYLKRWFSEVRDHVKYYMSNDWSPQLTVKESRDMAKDVLADAERQAGEILAKAKAEADRMVKAARDRHDDIIDNTRMALYAAIKKIEG